MMGSVSKISIAEDLDFFGKKTILIIMKQKIIARNAIENGMAINDNIDSIIQPYI